MFNCSNRISFGMNLPAEKRKNTQKQHPVQRCTEPAEMDASLTGFRTICFLNSFLKKSSQFFYTLTFKAIFLLWILFPSFSLARVYINELMQSNIDLVRDDLQEFPDSWMELFNDSEQAVNIQNWTVSIDANFRNGWKITGSHTILPHSYFLIYADKAAKGIHTDFRIDSGSGGGVYLFDANGTQIDVIINIPKQPAPNISYGRIKDGNASFAYFVTATPGAENAGTTSNTLLPSPVFSQRGGIYKNNVTLKLSLPAGAPSGVVLSDIHYTLDNTEPTANSPVYTGELTISKTTVVRAKLFHPNYLTNWSTVHTYIITNKDLALPVISISIDPSYLWDDEFGIYCKGNGKYGLTGKGMDDPVNWNNNWRRPINFEYFPLKSNSSALNQLCEMRISGGWTRANPQKSFVVYANKRFGTKRFDYAFFKEKPKQEIKSFMIRNSGNDFWWTHFRDAAIQLFMGNKIDVDYQAYQPAIFYLNGNYWGIQNLRERSTQDFILANYATKDADVIGNWWGTVKAGDRTAWNLLMNELRKSASQRNYEWLMNQVDIDEFINYMILQIYVSNTDFPGNNMVMWRYHQENGKWRFILKDLDFGLGIWDMNPVTHNALIYNTENNNDERKLFNALLTQESFKKKFYGRFAIYMGDLLHYKSTSQVIDSIQKILEPAMQDHLTRWMPEMWWRDMNSWKFEVSKIKTWCNGRNAQIYQHLRDYFLLGTIMKLTFEQTANVHGTPPVSINGVRIRNNQLDASYFQKGTIDLHYEGNVQSYAWEITKIVNGVSSVETYAQQNLSYQIVDQCTSVKIKLVEQKPLTSPEVNQPQMNISIGENRLQISDLQTNSIISIYDVSGKLLFQTTSNDGSIAIPFPQQGVFIVKIQNKTQIFTQKILIL